MLRTPTAPQRMRVNYAHFACVEAVRSLFAKLQAYFALTGTLPTPRDVASSGCPEAFPSAHLAPLETPAENWGSPRGVSSGVVPGYQETCLSARVCCLLSTMRNGLKPRKSLPPLPL